MSEGRRRHAEDRRRARRAATPSRARSRRPPRRRGPPLGRAQRPAVLRPARIGATSQRDPRPSAASKASSPSGAGSRPGAPIDELDPQRRNPQGARTGRLQPIDLPEDRTSRLVEPFRRREVDDLEATERLAELGHQHLDVGLGEGLEGKRHDVSDAWRGRLDAKRDAHGPAFRDLLDRTGPRGWIGLRSIGLREGHVHPQSDTDRHDEGGCNARPHRAAPGVDTQRPRREATRPTDAALTGVPASRACGRTGPADPPRPRPRRRG